MEDMLFVICGAGASFDSVPEEDFSSTTNQDWLPPVTRDLFANRPEFRDILLEYPECIPIVPMLRPLARTKDEFVFERALAQLQASTDGDDERKRQLAAVTFYLRDLLTRCGDEWHEASNGATNYTALAEAIRHHRVRTNEPVRFVTFNYDTMLDRAIDARLGLKMEHIGDYITDDGVRLYRPHGAANWHREIKNHAALRRADERANRDMNSGGLVFIDVSPSSRHLVRRSGQIELGEQIMTAKESPWGSYAWPALAVPIDGKDAFECPDDHIAALTADIKNASAVLIVGWRGMEAAFNDLWAQYMPEDLPVQVVASNYIEAFKICSRLRDAGWRMKSQPSASMGFSHYIRTRGEQQILNEHRRQRGWSHSEEGAQMRHAATRHMEEIRGQFDSVDAADDAFEHFMGSIWPTL